MNRRILALSLILSAVSFPSLAQQFLPVKGVVNARDLGGYRVRDGRTVRSGVLLRAAHLAGATDADLAYLSGIPVARVVDFRSDLEILGVEDRSIPGAETFRLPVDPTGSISAQMTEKEKKRFTSRRKFDVKKVIVMAAFNSKAQQVAREMYPTLVFSTDCQKQFAQFFRLVLGTGSGAMLYHCTQGKDRTGIASALLLAALGADRQTIVADFDATNRVYEADVRKYSRRVRFWGGKEEEVGVVEAFLGCNTANFIKTLDRIDSEYGSIENYLKGPMCLTDEDIQLLRDRYLEP